MTDLHELYRDLHRHPELPVEEKTGLDYASAARATNSDGEDVPVAHACGHDMHATCLIGAAAQLARSMIEDSLFGKPDVGR